MKEHYSFIRHTLHSLFQEQRLARQNQASEEIPTPEPDKPSQEEIRSLADKIAKIEQGDKDRLALRTLIDTFLQDEQSPTKLAEGELQQIGAQLYKTLSLHSDSMNPEQLRELDAQIEGMLSHEAMMNIAFQSGLISVEAYTAIIASKTIETAQAPQQHAVPVAGAVPVAVPVQPHYQCCLPRVRTRYIREAKMLIREELDPSTGQYIVVNEQSMSDIRRNVQRDKRARERARRRDEHPFIGIDRRVARMPGLTGHQRYAIAQESKRAYVRRKRLASWGIDPLPYRGPRSVYIDRTGKDRHHMDPKTAAYASYEYPSYYSPAAQGKDMVKYLKTQDKLRSMYAARLTPEIERRFHTLSKTPCCKDPAWKNLHRAYQNAKVQWIRNPDRQYGDLAILRSQLDAVEKRNRRNASMDNFLEKMGTPIHTETILPSGNKFGPNDTVRIVIPAEVLPYSDYDRVVLYKPWTVIGMESDAHFDQLMDAGIGIKKVESSTQKNYSGSNKWNAVRALELRFTKKGAYRVNGKLINVGGSMFDTASYAKESVENPEMSHTVTFGSRLRFGKTHPQLLNIEQPGENPITIQNLRNMEIGSTQVVKGIGVTRLRENQFRIDYAKANTYRVRGYRWRSGQYNAPDFTVDVAPGSRGVTMHKNNAAEELPPPV